MALVELELSAGELSSGRLSQRTLQKGLEALHHDGIVVIADVVPHEDIDRLDEAMQSDAKVLMARRLNGCGPPQDADPLRELTDRQAVQLQPRQSAAGATAQRPSPVLPINLPQPVRHPAHVGLPRRPPDAFLHQREHGRARTGRQGERKRTAGAFRCRLCSPDHPVGLCRQCRAVRDAAREWVDRCGAVSSPQLRADHSI